MKQIRDKLNDGEEVVTSFVGSSMLPLIKSKQPVKLIPIKWNECEKGDIVFCKVNGNYYCHLVKSINNKRGCFIGNNRGGINGWTKNVYGKVLEIY